MTPMDEQLTILGGSPFETKAYLESPSPLKNRSMTPFFSGNDPLKGSEGDSR